MSPVLQDLLVALQSIELLRTIRRHPRVEAVVVRAADHGNGIDLDIAQLFEAAQHGIFAGAKSFGRVQPLSDEGKAAGIVNR